MANIATGPVVADLAGKVGDNIYSRNRGGLYIKKFASPANPSSARQVEVRLSLKNAVLSWQAQTESNRIAWCAYANSLPFNSKLGNKIKVTGYIAFMRHAVALKWQPGWGNLPVVKRQEFFVQDVTINTLSTTSLIFDNSNSSSILDIEVHISACASQSPGVMSFNTPVFREIVTDDVFNAQYDVTIRYQDEFGLLAGQAGKKIFFKFKWTNVVTGQQYPEQHISGILV